MLQDFYLSLRKKFEKRKAEIARAILSGTPTTLEDYKCFLGKLRGIEELEVLLISLFKDWEEGKQLTEE